MTILKKNMDSLNKFFSKRIPVQTFEELQIKSGFQTRTLQRRMKEQGILASYNQNGKFYTATVYCRFNRDGIWEYNQILFSKVGNLYETIVYLIEQSTGGYTTKDLNEILRVKTDDAVRNLFLQQRIRREKIDGRYVYFSIDVDQFNKQFNEWSKSLNEVLPSLPDLETIILVLLAIIDLNSVEPNKIQIAVLERGAELSLEEITRIIGHYL